MKKLIKLGSKGDTIVEVLLAIAVMSMVLSISYGLANRSSQSNRQAQERAEAQKVGEEQLEILRGYVSPDQPWGTNVCFRADDPATTTVDETGQPTDQNSDCQGRGPGGRYNIRISVTGDATAGYVYTIDTTWDNVKGSTDQLAMSYKLPATGDIPRTPHFACSDGLDNDGDGRIDFGGGPSNDPDCTSATGTTETTPLPPPQIAVVVRKIPPGPGNTDPSCATPATLNRGGSRVTLNPGSLTQFTSSSNSTTTFIGLIENTTYTAVVTPPSGHFICPPASRSISSGLAGTSGQLDFKIAPDCYPRIIGYTAGYWAWGGRRADLDNWYQHDWRAGWNTAFVAGHYAAPGTFWYQYSGTNAWWAPNAAYYWVYQAYWVNGTPIYSNYCPS
ncbi:hypothetical protein HZB74_01270 [Candidatus Saccharibacteria bacterium]|nr:hypothetical protein [Candidatus Saccharibacteria bacterium]